MPVFPVVGAVAYTELAFDVTVAHHHVKLFVDFQKEVIITAIKLHRLSKEEKKIIEEPKDEDIQPSSPAEENKTEEPASPKQEPTIETEKEIKEIEVVDEPKAIEHKK